MSLTTKEAVRNLAYKRNISLDNYTDADITSLIAQAQSYIETETGRVFDAQTKTDEAYNLTGFNYVTDFYPIISVTQLKINENILASGAYKLDKKHGIIHLAADYAIHEWSWTVPYDLTITYSAGYNPALSQASQVCLDLILATIKNNANAIDGVITSLREGSLAVTYDRSLNSPFDIDQRIRKLKAIRIKQI